MENIKFFVPLKVPSGQRSQGRQTYIRNAKNFMPNFVKGKKMSKEIKYHCKVIFFQKQNVDIDNALKSLFDAMVNHVIPDDRQIVSLEAKFQDFQTIGTSVMLIRTN